jgi:hypothetical protein
VTHNARVISGRTHLAPLAALSLLASGLAVALTSSPAAAESFKERWCSDGKPVPCLLSATRNGVPLTSADPNIEIQMVGKQNTPDFQYTSFLVHDSSGPLSLTDTYSLTFDLGTLVPDYTESYASRPVVTRLDDGDGTHRLTFTGKPVLLTAGCNDSFPSVCPETATSQSYEFSGEIQEKKTNLEFKGFDRSQSVDTVNGIFLEGPDAGPKYLTSDWANSHFLTDGTTVVKGEARFRIPFAMLKDEFEVPDPETLVASSFKGTVNGKPADFQFTQDPAGGGVFVDISGVTFSSKKVKVARGVITPRAPKLLSAKRTTPASAKLAFEKAAARGAKPTAYVARCVAGKKSFTAKGGKRAFKKGLVVKGLTRGVRYSCSVRALSKTGPGKYSKTKKV